MDYNIPEIREPFNSSKYPKNLVRCITGDIGLHIGLGAERDNKALQEELGLINIPESPLTIRCYQCNQNNEMVEYKLHYHPVETIQEISIKSDGDGMKYLCSTFNHASLPIYKPEDFMIKTPDNYI